MDRQIVYQGQIPLETDVLLTNKNTMLALGSLMQAVFGTSVSVDGLACTPNTPAALNVLVGPGSIYSLQNVDGTAYGTIAADTTNQTVKQGLVVGTTTLNCPAPSTTGQSVVYLVQVAYQDTDAGSTVLPYYNASNPNVPWSGPNNTGVSQNTVRKGQCLVGVKTGVAATTGTQTTPSPDAGYTGLYAVTVANGQTTITSGNIQKLSTAPFIGIKLPGIAAAIQSGASIYAADTSGSANTITVSFTPAITALTAGMTVHVKVANTNTGAVVMNTNGLGNVSVVTTDGGALGNGALQANGIYEMTYDANGTRWQVTAITPSAASPFPAGFIADYAGSSAPTGWLLCYGQAISRTTYSGLFAAISTTYGVGDGSTTFNLPDFRGRVGAGKDDMGGSAANRITSTSGITGTTLGSAGGEETHALTVGELASHSHTATVTDPGHTHAVPTNQSFNVGLTNNVVSDNLTNPHGSITPTATTGITVSNGSTGSGTAHNNLQPTIIVSKIIKT